MQYQEFIKEILIMSILQYMIEFCKEESNFNCRCGSGGHWFPNPEFPCSKSKGCCKGS